MQIDYAFAGESRKQDAHKTTKDVQIGYAFVGKSRKQDAHNTVKMC